MQENNINQQFIRNFSFLHQDILNKGFIINYKKVPGFIYLKKYKITSGITKNNFSKDLNNKRQKTH